MSDITNNEEVVEAGVSDDVAAETALGVVAENGDSAGSVETLPVENESAETESVENESAETSPVENESAETESVAETATEPIVETPQTSVAKVPVEAERRGPVIKTPVVKPSKDAVVEEDGARSNPRKVREGIVVSDKMDMTLVVAVNERVSHPRYGKTVQRTKKLYVHDEKNDAKIGDRVRVQETRPLSKLKRWRLTEVVERAR